MADYRHPILQKRNQSEFQQKLLSLMEQNGMDVMMVLNPQHIYYATGYLSKAASIPGIMPGIFSVALISRQSEAVLFMTGLEADEAKLQTRNVEVVSLPTFYFIDDGTEASRQERGVDFVSTPAIQLALDTARDMINDPVIGLEMNALSFNAAETVLKQISRDNLVDCGQLLTEARRIKTPWEIYILRLGAQHWDRVVRSVAQNIEPGMNLLGMDELIMRTAWEMDSQQTLTNIVLITGCGPFVGLSGLGRNYTLQEGDLVKIDGGGVHLGYTTDISRVWSIGKPSPAKVACFDVLYSAFQKGLEMLKPGIKLSDMYNACRAMVESSNIIPSYPRGHIGHSISLEATLEDHPWITAEEHSVFEPGMVVSHEMSYAATANLAHQGSYNIEDTVLITDDGHERFSFVNETLEWNGE
jgi:Xaa-Pro dipeptidase